MINLVITRGLKKLAYGRYLSLSRYRMRKGLPGPPMADSPLTHDYDWSYIDGTPGMLNKGQSQRYVRDQEFGRTMVDFVTRVRQLREGNRKAAALSSSSQQQQQQQLPDGEGQIQ